MILGVLLPHTKLYGGVKRFLELGNIFVEKGHRFIVFTPDGLAPTWFDFKGEMKKTDEIPGFELDALWITEKQYADLLLSSSARHKIFYHVRMTDKVRIIMDNPEIETFACSSNIYEFDKKEYGRTDFKAIGGVNTYNYLPKTDYSCNDRPFCVMAYGRLVEKVKGTRFVVSACETLHRKGYNVKLLLFDTAVSEKAQKKIDAFKCNCPYEFVQNHPFSRNSELFNRADCFVSAENAGYAGWNNTVAEAMACALPIVSTKAGSLDLIFDGETGLVTRRWGWFVRRNIEKLINDEQLRKKLGTAAHKQILKFDWHEVADNIIKYVSAEKN